MTAFILTLRVILWITLGVLALYMLRHYVFALARLFLPPREAYQEWAGHSALTVTVLIPMHNEERVCRGVLEALAKTTFDFARLQVIPINDRSTDGTEAILDDFAKHHPWCEPFHRKGGQGGKPAALADTMSRVRGEVIILFDADYIPGRGLLDALVAPFGDPEIGAVMGRVVPQNGHVNLLTRILDLERSGGYQVNQQARWDLRLVPQFGGTVGGIRVCALEAAGGWNPHVLAEDTDLTFRLLAMGWKVAYVNRAECYEEVVETWSARRKQVKRWAMGHMQVCMSHIGMLLRNPYLGFWEKADSVLLLGIYFVPTLTLLGWLASLLLLLLNPEPLVSHILLLMAFLAFGTVGNFATFYEIGLAVALDGNSRRLRLLPVALGGFLASLIIVSGACFHVLWNLFRRNRQIAWDKTPRFRKTP